MKITESKIIVCCSQAISGGPELLHQLVHELRATGRDAHIAYFPFEEAFECPQQYKKYDAPQCEISDDINTFVLIPEVATWISRRFKKARVGVWWLSVDNYFLAKHQSKLVDIYLRYKSLIRSRVPLFNLRHLSHFTQSKYATDFLASNNINSTALTDYLGDEHLKNQIQGISAVKKNVIVFNPKKGQKQTKALMAAYPEITFIPIENMSSQQVVDLLRSAKIYIDFGHHPGKDRPPREAAMAGCCVITGRKGSAANREDVAIPDIYKLNDDSSEYVSQFGELAKSIFDNYLAHAKEYDAYRTIIIREPSVFRSQVNNLFS